jgi:RIO-like serine/threonine protein kinase
MNKQIRSLAETAGYFYDVRKDGSLTFTDYPGIHGDLNMFAELIIKECTIAFWNEECMYSDLAIEEYHRNVNKIREHFRKFDVAQPA